jgi:hypothetical protein
VLDTPYIYFFCRKDLQPNTRLVQTAHAAYEAAVRLSPPDIHPHFVVLAVKDEAALHACVQDVGKLGVPFCTWHEPDLDNQLTAFAVGPVHGETRKHFRKYRLLGAEG